MALRAEFWELRDERYHRVPLRDNRIFLSKVLPGFWLDVTWLFADELPDELACLEAILATLS